ncbi:MAG: hypothetical protein HY898_10045 [Deltaproteobacteria bacterium]|nr:hypothetical protein [Deltaproteobacteria bacterium]
MHRSKRAMHSWVASVAVLAIGCARQTSPSPSEAGVASAPAVASAAPSASAAPDEISLRLVARRDAEGKKVAAWLVAPEIGLDLRVAELKLPLVCRMDATPEGGEVTCTPDARIKKAVIQSEDAGHLLVTSGGSKRSIALPPGRSWKLAPAEISARDIPELACTPGAAERVEELKFWGHNHMIDGNYLRMMIPLEKRGEVQVIELFSEKGPNTLCRSEGTTEQRTVRCDRAKASCKVGVDGESIVFECDGSRPHKGRVLLPCGAKGKLVTEGIFEQTVTYW